MCRQLISVFKTWLNWSERCGDVLFYKLVIFCRKICFIEITWYDTNICKQWKFFKSALVEQLFCSLVLPHTASSVLWNSGFELGCLFIHAVEPGIFVFYFKVKLYLLQFSILIEPFFFLKNNMHKHFFSNLINVLYRIILHQR